MRLFDLHCDTLSLAFPPGESIVRHCGEVDLQRGRAFQPWVQAFAAFLPDALSSLEAWRRCCAMLDRAASWEKEHPQDFHVVRKGESLSAPFDGCRCLLTVENGGVLGDDLDLLDVLHSRGVRMVGLTWNGDNPWGCGCGGCDSGLTAIGEAAVKRLEHNGMTVDVSHLGDRGFWQVAEMTTRPFVASHSNARAICSHPRNLTDDQFCAIRDRGGLVGINLYPLFLGGEDFACILPHVEHFLSLDGERTVCFGADFDGMTAPPGWNGLAVMSEIWDFLQRCGYSSTLLDGLFYKNAMNFFESDKGNT